MPDPSLDIVKAVLAVRDRQGAIYRSMSGAWTEFLEKYPQRAWWRRKSTRAHILWEHSVENAVKEFESDSGCKAIPHDDTMSFVFDQTVLVRFKKADFELKTRNFPTFLAQLFHAHEYDLFGFQGMHRVEAAYVLNQYQTALEWVGIVARNKSHVLWQIDLEPASNVEPFPQKDDSSTAAERVLRPKIEPTRKPQSEPESDK